MTSDKQEPLEKTRPMGALSADMKRLLVYEPEATLMARIVLLACNDGIWALTAYRCIQSVRNSNMNVAFRVPLLCALRTVQWFIRIVTGIVLHEKSQLAAGQYIGHYGSIYIGSGVKIGMFSSVSQTCYIGSTGDRQQLGFGSPVLGERVYVGPGAKVVGKIRVGNGAVIGANAAVFSDVPDNAVVVGNPARIVSMRGSAHVIYLGEGMVPTDVRSAEEGHGHG